MNNMKLLSYSQSEVLNLVSLMITRYYSQLPTLVTVWEPHFYLHLQAFQLGTLTGNKKVEFRLPYSHMRNASEYAKFLEGLLPDTCPNFPSFPCVELELLIAVFHYRSVLWSNSFYQQLLSVVSPPYVDDVFRHALYCRNLHAASLILESRQADLTPSIGRWGLRHAWKRLKYCNAFEMFIREAVKWYPKELGWNTFTSHVNSRSHGLLVVFDWSQRSPSGNTLLHYVCRRLWLSGIGYACSHHPELQQATNKRGRTPLMVYVGALYHYYRRARAVFSHHRKNLESRLRLMLKDCEVLCKNDWQCFLEAAFYDNTEVMKACLTAGIPKGTIQRHYETYCKKSSDTSASIHTIVAAI